MEQRQDPNNSAPWTDRTNSGTRVNSTRQSRALPFRRMLPAIATQQSRVESINTSSPACSNEDSERAATPSSSRFKVTDASIDPEKQHEVFAPSAAPPRLGPSLTKRHVARQTTRGDMNQSIIQKETSQLLQITEGVRRRVSTVLKYAGIDIDTETDKLKQLWQTFDSDGDGTIDYQEFCKYTCDLLEIQKKENGEAATLTMIENRLIQLVTLESKRF